MSRRTRTNLPLPVIGSTGWGGTLNNYLTNQTYAQTELETEIQKIYDNKMNVAQTVLSSGIMDSSVEEFKIGLYEEDNYDDGFITGTWFNSSEIEDIDE